MRSTTGTRVSDTVIRDREREIESGRIEVYNDLWFDEKKPMQPWNDNYAFPKSLPVEEAIQGLTEEYPEIFSIADCGDGRITVDLKQLAYNIPSLWNEELLPKKPTEAIYIDQSRAEVFLADITSAMYGYKGITMEARICNVLSGHKIRIFQEYPTDRSKIHEIIPIGATVYVNAQFTLGCKYEFTGVKVVPVLPGVEDDEKLQRIARGDLGENAVLSLLSTSYTPLKDLIAAEKTMVKFIDEIFGDDTLGHVEIEQRLIKITDYDHFFRNAQEVLEFVDERPHLYYYNGHRAWVRYSVRRRMNNALLGLLSVKKGKTLEQIQNALNAVSDGDDLQLIFEERLKDHIDSVASLLIIKENPNRTVYSLKWHFDKKEKVLLPDYPKTN